MKSTEPQASITASRLQTKSKSAFFAKQQREASGPEKGSIHSSVQTKPQSSLFFTNSGNSVQPKLEVHPSDDSYEKEADAMADGVMQQSRGSRPDPQKGSGEGNQVQKTPLYYNISHIQRQRAFESPTVLELNTSNLSPSDEMPLQRKSKPDFIQAKEEGSASDAPSGMDAALNSAKGHGAPLPEETRSRMESGFGTDFSRVNIHTDHVAEQMNQQVGARAFTHGNDIYFNRGEYKPNTESGDHLLAHELTHTVQQGAGVQKKSNIIQKKAKNPDILKASAADLKDTADKRTSKTFPGEITTDGKSIQVHLKKVQAKYYLTKKDLNFLDDPKAPIKIKKPRQERDTNQIGIWKKELKPKVKEKLKKSKTPELTEDGIHAIKPKQSKPQAKALAKSTIYGNLDRLADEITIPPWNRSGTGGIYDVEHKLDYQIAQGLADDIDNLILLDRKTNQELGTSIEKIINEHLAAVLKDYVKDFSNISENPKTTKNRFDIYIDSFKFEKKPLPKNDFWENTDVQSDELLDSVEVEDSASIPKNHFLLMSSDSRAAYLLPLNVSNKQIGGFLVTVESNGNVVKKISMQPVKVNDPTKLIQAKVTNPEDTPFEALPGKESERVYMVKNSKTKVGAALKGLIGGVKGMSLIELNEPELDGFDIKVNGKVVSTLTFLKDVDISFGYENGEFFIKAEIPLTKLTKNIPKPFIVTACSIALEANSANGLSISGNARFKIEKFGEGEIIASAGKSISFEGSFNFDSKLFNPALVKVSYTDGKWAIEGNIGVLAGAIKGVKEAALHVKYADGALTADGNAKLDVPGIDSIKLSASYSESAGFKFVATADLKKLPGIKSGSVTISLLSKGDGPIILGVGGTAEPDFPGVPGLNTSLTVMYEDGVFDMRAKVNYKKGRFDGAVEVGVTNKAVDEKGQPQGDPQKGAVVVFGFGLLTVDLFKGSKGTINVRLTPDKQLLVAGSFSIRNVKPFGDGVNIKKGKEFPSVKIPLVGIPGVSIFFEIGGGAYFTFNWDPLVLKELTISFKETNINEIETAQVDIHGEVGSKAVAEAYMEIKASLGAQVLVAVIKGSLAGNAGIGVEAEAGGTLDAGWNNEKGLLLKEINAYVAVNPKAIFRLKGSVSVDLDLWITTINLYYKEWILAEGAADLSGLSLKVNFPLKFDENGDLIKPGFEQLNIEKPDFSGEQGKAALDSGINSGAKEERKLAKDKLRQQIADDMRGARKDEDFSPTEYAKKMKKKYNKDEEMKTFIMDSVEEEVKIQEYEEFDQLKNELRKSELTLNQKIGRAMVFKMFRARISPGDYDAFITELLVAEQQKQEAARNPVSSGQPALTT